MLEVSSLRQSHVLADEMSGRVDLLLHILITMYDQECGSRDGQTVCVGFLRSATSNVEANIRKARNGERAWQLLEELYQKRDWQEKYLRDERGLCALSAFRL